MNELTSPKLKVLDAMNDLGLRLTWMIIGRELRALDATKSYGFWMTWTTHDYGWDERLHIVSLGL